MKIIIEKGDSEEQIKMAEALLANKLVSAIETVAYKCQKVYKSDDEVAKAVIVVVGLFGVCTQWTADRAASLERIIRIGRGTRLRRVTGCSHARCL